MTDDALAAEKQGEALSFALIRLMREDILAGD
jgi:hypothetical protein